MGTLRIATAAALTLVVGLALAGCGEKPPAADSSSSEAEQQGADTAFEPLTQENIAQRITDAQMKAGTAHLSQVMEIAGQKMTAEGDMTFTADFASTKAHVTQSGPTGETETILVDGQMYMNLGELSQNKFVQFGEGNGMFEPKDVIGAFSPQTQMETFGKAIKEFTVGESEVIDGVETTQYTLLLDSTTLLSGSLTAGVDPALVGDTITYVLWVGNEDDLQRRTIMTFTDASTTAEFTRWGEPVDIQAPSPDQIGSL